MDKFQESVQETQTIIHQCSRSFHKIPVTPHHPLKNPNFSCLQPSISPFNSYFSKTLSEFLSSLAIMASETGFSDQQSFMQEFMNSTNRGIALFFPFILGFNSTNPSQETQNQDQSTPSESRDRVIFINPFAQSMVVMENNGGLEPLFGNLFSRKSGQKPASKASIDAMQSVQIENGDDEQCVVCLEEWEAGEMAKEMPCKHRFHGDCIEKWLKISGCCPVCRYQMPVDEDGKSWGESDGERRRGAWVSFTFGGGWRNGENLRSSSDDSSENSDPSSNH